jgi:hypothetical protein
MTGCETGVRIGGPSIEGTYRFVSRDLPNGQVVTAPAMDGMLSYTDDYRNFNIYWTDAAGRRFSIGYIAEYEIVDGRYWERSLYRVVNDEINGSGLMYDLSRPAGAADVTTGAGGSISFTLPLYGEPRIEFTRDGLTATLEGQFVDHWDKVD